MAIVWLLLMEGFGSTSGQTLTTLYQFGGFATDGSYPAAGLVQGRDGSFYSTTLYGGTNGLGTVFKISTNGALTTLHSFTGHPLDGEKPQAGLVQGSDGNFYGTTIYGGTNNQGTVFRVSTNGALTTLHSFVGAPVDGAWPEAGLVQGSDGYFYGTTYYGGMNNSCANSGCGTVFKIGTNGSLTTLYSFSGGYDGQRTQAGLVQGGDGCFYGTTVGGGTNSNGTVFKISSDGSLTTLYYFTGGNDGAFPLAAVVQGSDGNFYGTTELGGTNGSGTVFKMSANGALTNLYSFTGGNDGADPSAGLVQGSDGNFYGMTSLGGTSYFNGIVFKIRANGTLTNLHSFTGGTDGGSPYAGLVQGSDGSFYGTTLNGGTNGVGVVFKLTVPLGPPPYPINQITSAQVAGTNLIFTIPSIAGETYQLQFSSSMKPTNWVNVSGGSVTNGIGALLTLTNFGGALSPQGFYRFDITP